MPESIVLVELDGSFNPGKRFELRRQLGSGGMGRVYEAFDRELQELVALKTLQRADGRWLARFKREFRSLHDLTHPNLVALGELFDSESSAPFFTMELVRGVDFLAHVRRGRPGSAPGIATAPTELLDRAPGRAAPGDGARPASGPRIRAPIPYDEARLRAALPQLAVAIATLHQAGLIHRDIKPTNILVDADGRLVLLDFGLVAALGSAVETVDTGLVGTLAYMAPEQAAAGEVGPSADWYSLGVVLFEALTGALPHSAPTPYQLILAKNQSPAAPPRQIAPATPPDLDALCTALLQTQAADRPPLRDIFDRLGITTGPERRLATSSSGSSRTAAAAFVGRSAELAALRAAYDSVRDQPLVYLVEGVSGVGKSQLVDRFLERLAAAEPDTVILAGRCYEREVLSFKAFDGIADALARFLSHLTPVQLAELMPMRPALLARLFPVLKRVGAIAGAPTIPDVPDPQDQRLRMFAALRELFLRLAERRRLVWYIDDLQWTDADSLILLADLIAHEERLPVFIVATMRPVDDAPRKALLDRLEALAPTQRLSLGELTPDEARELTERLLPDRDPAAREALAAEAGGHPLLLLELARHVGDSGDHAAIGANLDEMLAARIATLGSGPRALLEVIALAGGPLTQEVSAVAAELSSADQVKSSNVLRAAHLIRTDGIRRTDRIVTYHDRVREHVCARLTPERGKALHRRLAVALEQTGAAEHDPRALVRHARAAGLRATAADYARAAARHASAALAFDQAAEFLADAIELGDYDEPTLRGLRIELATALMHAGRGPEAAATFMTAAEGAEPAVRLDCQRQAADQWLITGHLERGMAALESSLTDIGEPPAASPRRALARVLWNRARLRLRGTRYRTRLESQIPVETLRRLDVLRAVAHGLAMVDNIRGADFNGRYLLLALRAGETRRLLGAMASEVVFLASQGGRAAQRGRRLYDEVVCLADRCSDRAYAQTWVLLADGASSFFEGRFRPAVEALEETEEIFADGPAGLTYEKNNVRVFRVHALRLLGAIQRHGSLIHELVRTGRQRGDRYLETTLRLLQGESLLARDDVAGARASIEESTWTPPEKGYHLQHWYELRARAELALYLGDGAAALDRLDGQFDALERSMLLRVKLVRIDAIALRARLLVAAGSPGSAHAQRAEHIARRLERERVGYATVFALLLRAGLARRAGDQDAAVAHLQRAVDESAAADMALHLAAAQDRLGALLGGDRGSELRAAAATYARKEQIARPEAMFEAVATGLLDR